MDIVRDSLPRIAFRSTSPMRCCYGALIFWGAASSTFAVGGLVALAAAAVGLAGAVGGGGLVALFIAPCHIEEKKEVRFLGARLGHGNSDQFDSAKMSFHSRPLQQRLPGLKKQLDGSSTAGRKRVPRATGLYRSSAIDEAIRRSGRGRRNFLRRAWRRAIRISR